MERTGTIFGMVFGVPKGWFWVLQRDDFTNVMNNFWDDIWGVKGLILGDDKEIILQRTGTIFGMISGG